MKQRPHVLRRFVLLGGETYYAKGGFQDFHSSHDTLEDAIGAAHAAEKAPKYFDQIEWWHVWDCETNAVVAVSDGSAYGASDPWPKLDEPPEVNLSAEALAMAKRIGELPVKVWTKEPPEVK